MSSQQHLVLLSKMEKLKEDKRKIQEKWRKRLKKQGKIAERRKDRGTEHKITITI